MKDSNHQSVLIPMAGSDIERINFRLSQALRNTLDAFPQLFIAGGFVRAVTADESVKDIDIFTTDLSVVERAVQFYIRQRGSLGVKEVLTPCTITVTDGFCPVQFVNNIAYESIEQCVAQFDFTVFQAAYWRENFQPKAVCVPEFIRDVAERRLVYTAPDRVEAPGGSLWRAIKYAQRGYSITQLELARLIERLVEGQKKLKLETFKAHGMIVDDTERYGISASEVVRSFSMRGRFGGSY